MKVVVHGRVCFMSYIIFLNGHGDHELSFSPCQN